MSLLKDRIVVLIANQRTGTNLLREILDFSGRFLNVGELFLSDLAHESAVTPAHWRFDLAAVNFFRYRTKRFRSNPELSVPSAENLHTLFTDYFTFVVESMPSGKKLLLDIKYNSTGHFDTFWHHRYECPFLVTLLREAEIPVIHQKRAGFLSVIVSEIVSDANRRYEWRASDPTPIYQPVTVDPVHIEHRIRDLRWECRKFHQWLWEYPRLANVCYEDMVAGDPSFDSKVTTAISAACGTDLEPGLWSKYQAQDWALRKVIQNPFAVIKNLAEIKAHLLTTDLAMYVGGRQEE